MTPTAAPSTATDGASTHPPSATAVITDAATIARRSPIRAASAPAGRSPSTCPIPTSATTNAATPTDAPSSRADSAMTG